MHDRAPCATYTFPTRRSSDLIESGVFDVRETPTRTMSASSRPAPTRSEEHTSELQSPDHLVCRLLLEKQKISRSWTGVEVSYNLRGTWLYKSSESGRAYSRRP